jgi:hypothetical protein
MTKEFKMPDPETRAKNIAGLKEFCRQLDLFNLQLDECLAILDKHEREQRRDRLLSKSNYIQPEDL